MIGTGVRQLLRALCGILLALVPLTAASSQDVVPPKAAVLTPGGINVADGSWVYSQIDLSMGPLTLERHVRGGSRQPNDPMFGSNFSSNFDIYVARTTGINANATNIVHIGNSASGNYASTSSGGLFANADYGDAEKGRLAWTGTQYVYTDSSGTIYTFSATISVGSVPFSAVTRRVERIDFPDGRRQTFSYTAGAQPRLVEDSSGYAILFDYNGNGDVSAACIFKRSETYVSTSSTCAGAALKVTYTYTAVGSAYRLTNVTDVLGQTTSYYPCLKPPGYASCTMTLGGRPLVSGQLSFYVTQTLADQGTWTVSGAFEQDGDGAILCADGNMHAIAFSPDGKGNIDGTFSNSSPRTLSDGLGQTTNYLFTGSVLTNPPINASCNLYADGSMLNQAVYSEGDKYEAEYGGPFKSVTVEHQVPKGGGVAREKLYQYGNSCTVAPGTFQNCARPTGIRDPAGNWTNFTYAGHGGVLTEMAPAPAAGGARPLKVTTWIQRYAWLKSSSGALVQNLSFPVWVKNTETVCQTVAGASPAATCDPAALQAVTTYEYGASGTGQSLLVKGVVVTADGASLRTCYGYDLNDRKIYETQP
ncbi:MAG TPA: hypothetical protein VI168_17835, partial [Croceibacterium sp.]